ncbi:MAG: protein associated with RNAse G/E [Candidatus Paceibacteria bacterium]|jgi:protein associated with RNAse G/E
MKNKILFSYTNLGFLLTNLEYVILSSILVFLGASIITSFNEMLHSIISIDVAISFVVSYVLALFATHELKSIIFWRIFPVEITQKNKNLLLEKLEEEMEKERRSLYQYEARVINEMEKKKRELSKYIDKKIKPFEETLVTIN